MKRRPPTITLSSSAVRTVTPARSSSILPVVSGQTSRLHSISPAVTDWTLVNNVPVPIQHARLAARSGAGATAGAVIGAVVFRHPVATILLAALGGALGAASTGAAYR
jgi:hypothetical protein